VAHLPLSVFCVVLGNLILFGGKNLKSCLVLLDGGVGLVILGKVVDEFELHFGDGSSTDSSCKCSDSERLHIYDIYRDCSI